MKRACSLLLSVAILVPAGCRRQASLESKAAVEAAIQAHLSQRGDLAMDKMMVEVQKVEFRGETAEADVVFRLKDAPGEMTYHYSLRRQGDRWVVERGRGGGLGGTDLPPGHPPVTGSPTPPKKLPRTGQR